MQEYLNTVQLAMASSQAVASARRSHIPGEAVAGRAHHGSPRVTGKLWDIPPPAPVNRMAPRRDTAHLHLQPRASSYLTLTRLDFLAQLVPIVGRRGAGKKNPLCL